MSSKRKPKLGGKAAAREKDGKVVGFDCAHCGKEHLFPAYVYGHWNIDLSHACDCGAKHDILAGVATFRRAGAAA